MTRQRAVRALAGLCGLVGALGAGGCEVLLDFGVHADARPADAPPTDAMLVPDPCGVLEPDDNPAGAQLLTTGESRYAAICPANDIDYYKVHVATGQTLDFKILFKNKNGDLDLQLYDSSGTSLVAESRSFDDDEEIKCPNDSGMSPTCTMLSAGDYVVRVFAPVAGDTNVYRLGVTIAP
jgi:Bacterial pre-peptidase C-terminal domain